MHHWFEIDNVYEIDSPGLLVYKSRVVQNIDDAISMMDDVARLRPHVKTCKNLEVVSLMMDAGITKFKCATIAEAEMLALAGATDVLLAYQPVGPKLLRLITLQKKYPRTVFSCLLDNIAVAQQYSAVAVENNLILRVFVDLNVGMNRTGIKPGEEAVQLYSIGSSLPGLHLCGLHAYDGHLRSPDLTTRTEDCNAAFKEVEKLRDELLQLGYKVSVIVAGGSPTFPIHAQRQDQTIECSPGTFVYWDGGYQQSCPEQPFRPASLVLCRIVSLPDDTTICIDLGHKSIASENALNRRVHFLNAPDLHFLAHSEEHLVAEAPGRHNFKPGDVLYGLPFHICPTVALYERAMVVVDGVVTDEWSNIARDRKITS